MCTLPHCGRHRNCRFKPDNLDLFVLRSSLALLMFLDHMYRACAETHVFNVLGGGCHHDEGSVQQHYLSARLGPSPQTRPHRCGGNHDSFMLSAISRMDSHVCDVFRTLIMLMIGY